MTTEWKCTHKIWAEINKTKEITLTMETISELEDILSKYHQQKVKENELLHDIVASDLIKIENAYIEDAEVVGSYDVTGRVKQLWITQNEFDKIKCINN